MASIEYELRRIAKRRQASRKRCLKEDEERDEAIRRARGQVTQPRLAEIFDLSLQRIKQIQRGPARE